MEARARTSCCVGLGSLERSPAEGASFTMSTVPWPPVECPVSGMRRDDSADRRKQLLKVALLRWHPDKFEAAHGGKLKPSEHEAVMEKVTATLRRVQAERAACAELEQAPANPPSHPSAPMSASASARRAAACTSVVWAR